MPKYPAAILVLSLLMLIPPATPVGILGLIIYIITWKNLKKTTEYHGFQFLAAAEAALKKGQTQEAVENYTAALNLKPEAGTLYK